jgi:hypothetical protein
MRSEGLGIAVVAGLLVAGTACTTGLGQGNGILASSTRGVVLSDGGTHANAGMDTGNTCFVDPKNGFLGTERDYPGVEDEVEDIGRYYGTDSILVASDRGLHVGSADPASYDEPYDLVIGGIIEARLAENDIGVLVRRVSEAESAEGSETPGEAGCRMFGGIQVRSDSEGESKLTSGAAFDESLALEARVGNTPRPMNGEAGSLNQ